MKTLSATGPSLGPVIWKLSPGCSEKQFRFRHQAASFGGAVADNALAADEAANGSCDNDFAAFFAIGGILFNHLTSGFLAEHEGTGEIGGNNLLEVRGGVFLAAFPIFDDQCGRTGNTSVVDENI